MDTKVRVVCKGPLGCQCQLSQQVGSKQISSPRGQWRADDDVSEENLQATFLQRMAFVSDAQLVAASVGSCGRYRCRSSKVAEHETSHAGKEASTIPRVNS